MDITVFFQLWKELRGFIEQSDIHDAATILVDTLIENDFEPEEIASVFKRDPEVMAVLEFAEIATEEEDEDDIWDEEADSEEDW